MVEIEATERLNKQGANKIRFSMLSLMTLIAVASVWLSFALAQRKNKLLRQRIEALQAISSRLDVTDEAQLASADWPRVDSKFSTWEVHVPAGKQYELRLAAGEVSEGGMPPDFDSVSLAPGQHRITAKIADSRYEDYRIDIYLDGKLVIERPMDKSWMPDGWSSGSGMSWPGGFQPTSIVAVPRDCMQLMATSYMPRHDFGSRNYFNSSADDWVTRPGFRLWIDLKDQIYQPVSPFMGFKETSYLGFGLRDGLRFSPSNQYAWQLTRPSLESRSALLEVKAEFLIDDQLAFSEASEEFRKWKLSRLLHEAGSTIATATLSAEVNGDGAIAPVVELAWDANRPDEMAVRLPVVSENDRITRWRLRIGDGLKHLWRQVSLSGQGVDFQDASQINRRYQLKPQADSESSTVTWATDQEAPLQFLERTRGWPQSLTRENIYRGLPVGFAASIQSSLSPVVTFETRETLRETENDRLPGAVVTRVLQEDLRDTEKAKIPGGPIMESLILEMEGPHDSYIWITAKPSS